MWTDFDEPPHTILAETAAARERARSKKRRKQPPRSKRKSTGAPNTASGTLTLRKPTSSTASTQPAASVTQTDPVILGLEAIRNEQPEAPQTSILQVAPPPDALVSTIALVDPSKIKHDEAVEVNTFAVSTKDDTIISRDEIDGGQDFTSMVSVICAIEQQSPERRAHHRAFRSVGLAGMGLVGLFGALWLLNPGSQLEVETPSTIDQAPVLVRVWTDPVHLEQVRTAAEISPIALQPKQQAVAAPTGLAVVQKAPSEVSPHTNLPTDNQLVEATSVPLISMPQEVVQSASVASVPLPPRRPISIITRHVPVMHLISNAAAASTAAPVEQSIEQTLHSEPYASFSARKHEIGNHKLAWGMARLHEDPNSDSCRGAVWDFVPSKP